MALEGDIFDFFIILLKKYLHTTNKDKVWAQVDSSVLQGANLRSQNLPVMNTQLSMKNVLDKWIKQCQYVITDEKL